MVLIENCSREYRQKIIPISTQKYKGGGVMEKSVLDITTGIRNKKNQLQQLKLRMLR